VQLNKKNYVHNFLLDKLELNRYRGKKTQGGDRETHIGFRSSRWRRCWYAPFSVVLGHWMHGESRPLAGRKVSVLRLVYFQCLLWDSEATATS
jgi:hypothetical protein